MNWRIASLHLTLGIAVVLGVTLVAIRTVLVNQTYGPLPLAAFFKLSTYQRLQHQSSQPEIDDLWLLDEQRVHTLDGEISIELPTTASEISIIRVNKTAVLQYRLDTRLHLYDLATKEPLTTFQVTPTQRIVGLVDTSHLLVATPVSETVWETTLMSNSPAHTAAVLLPADWKVISRGVPFYDSEQHVLSYNQCDQYCSAVIYDVATQETRKVIPLFTDPSYKPSLVDADLLFVDVLHGLLAYKTPNHELYVVDFETELLQNVRLVNDRNQVQFLGYFAQTKQLVFTLVEKSGAYQQLAVYAADKPSLHLLQKVPVTTSIKLSTNRNLIQIGTSVFSLDGRAVTALNGKTIISGQ